MHEDRHREDAEHLHLAADLDVTLECRQPVGLVPVDVDAGLHVDRARRDADVELGEGPELQGRLELGDAVLGVEPDDDESAAPEQRDDELERVRPLGEAELHGERLAVEG